VPGLIRPSVQPFSPMKTFLYVVGVLMIILDIGGGLMGSISPARVTTLSVVDGIYVSATFVMATVCICTEAIIGAVERAAKQKTGNHS
jgi:hypothetical protein